MSCGAIRSWTFSGLVGAFLDLGIAYLLLWASSLAYFASKFLGFFGLCLPCPCKGLLGNSSDGPCLQRALVDYPSKKTSLVQLSVKNKFPFYGIWSDDPNSQFNAELVDERNRKDRHIDLEGEVACSSLFETAKDIDGRGSVERNGGGFEFGMGKLPALKGSFSFKRKGAAGQRNRLGLRHRHKGRAVDHGKSWLVLSHDRFCLDAKDGSQTSASVCKLETDITEEGSSAPVNSGDDGFSHGWAAPVDISLRESPHGLGTNESVYEVKSVEKEASSGEEFRSTNQRELGFDGNQTNTVRVLEQALEEEYAARAALYLELEKERCAAASATDEAMAMILRLQEEKALIEMEARQYQRMTEEKSAYDAEEMNILKEILLRREREKHFLDKEVEAYRQMMLGNDQLDADMAATQAQGISSFLYSSEDPMLILEQINKSVCEKEKATNTKYEVPSLDLQNRALASGKELPYPGLDENADYLKQRNIVRQPSIDKHPKFQSCDEFHEMTQFPMNENPLTQEGEFHKLEAQSKLTKSSSPHGFVGSIDSVGEGQEQSDEVSLPQRSATKTIGVCNEGRTLIAHNVDNMDMCGTYKDQKDKFSPSSVCDSEPRVHDIRVIDDESSMSNEGSVKKSEQLSRNFPLKLRRSESDLEIRSRSDTTSGLPPKVPSRGKPSASDLQRNSMSPIELRRNSMSSIDYERLKIDSEVEWLQERLRIVQEGRDKLNFSMGHKEREKVQFQLLDNIASQLREIQQLTQPVNTVRQASLPPPSSKVMSKKRCWRSTSLGGR